MKKSVWNYIAAFIGIAFIAFGLFSVKTFDYPQGFWLALPYVCIGIGCGTFGHSMGTIVSHKALKNYPHIQKNIKIEKEDERNIAVTSHAKAKAYDLMTYVFGALLLAFALMGIDMVTLLLLVCAYLFVQGYAVYCRCKYEKEM